MRNAGKPTDDVEGQGEVGAVLFNLRNLRTV
jgi:hypothetical protein